MVEVLAVLCPALFFVCAPLVLLTRFLWPRTISWWAVFLCVSCLGWVLLVLGEHFEDVRYQQCLERRLEGPVETEVTANGLTEVINPECPFLFIHSVETHNSELGWLWALIYLGPWLALYGIACLVRKRVVGAKLS